MVEKEAALNACEVALAESRRALQTSDEAQRAPSETRVTFRKRFEDEKGIIRHYRMLISEQTTFYFWSTVTGPLRPLHPSDLDFFLYGEPAGRRRDLLSVKR